VIVISSHRTRGSPPIVTRMTTWAKQANATHDSVRNELGARGGGCKRPAKPSADGSNLLWHNDYR
jgi:hypothetical protein